MFCGVWKTELGSGEHGYLAEDIFKQSAEDVVWFLLAACNKMSEMNSGRNCSTKRNQHLTILKSHSLSRLQKDGNIGSLTVRKTCSGEKAKCVAVQPFAKGISCLTHGGSAISWAEQRGVIQERSAEPGPLTHMGDAQGF